jgi:hypothetical protein
MTTQEFIAKATPENTELTGKFKGINTPEDGYAMAKAEGVTDSFEDFVAVMTKTYEAIKDLSEDDLDMVAGGEDGDIDWAVLSVVTSISVTAKVSMVTIASAAVIALAV